MRRTIAGALAALVAALVLTVAQPSFADNKVINLNTATTAELVDLKGIGQAKAQAIVAYRDKNGAFKSVDDLRHVQGIGAKLLEQIRPQITVGSADTKSAAKQ